MKRVEIFSPLNGLIETCNDGEHGFRTCVVELHERLLRVVEKHYVQVKNVRESAQAVAKLAI